MAGDWLKMEHATTDKPETFAIAGILGIEDPDLVVGKLFRVWRWFDQHTVDGNAVGVTSALLDRIACCNGFATAMQKVGWLVVTDSGLSLPKFDRHNGKTAKTRAETARRVAKHRGCNAAGNGDDVTSALAREEKRREEKKEQKQKPLSPSAPTKLGTSLPEDWKPTDEQVAQAKAERPDVDVLLEARKFVDFWIGKPGKDGRKRDWPATWRNWIRNARSSPRSAVNDDWRGVAI